MPEGETFEKPLPEHNEAAKRQGKSNERERHSDVSDVGKRLIVGLVLIRRVHILNNSEKMEHSE